MPIITLQRRKKKGLYKADQVEILEYIIECNKPIFNFLKETGRRFNEARAFKVKDLNFKTMAYRIGAAFDMERFKPFPKVEDHAEEEFPSTEKLLEFIKIVLKGRIYSAEDFVYVIDSAIITKIQV